MPFSSGYVLGEMLDLPALRDQDLCEPLFYWAVCYMGSPDEFRGAVLQESVDGTTYHNIATMSRQAVMGVAETALGDPPTDCPKWDNVNTVDVRVITPGGSLSSHTEAEVLQAVPGTRIVIGNEIIGFKTATAQADGTTRLSGLLRGLRATRDLAFDHLAGERAVLLDVSELSVRKFNRSEVGLLRYYKIVPAGGDPADYEAQAFEPHARNMQPFPVQALAGAWDGGNNLDVSWTRRSPALKNLTRMSPQCACCCVEDWYEIDLYEDGDPDTCYATYRDILTTSYEIPSADLSAAGYTPGDPVDIAIFQISCAVGRGVVRREYIGT